MRPAAEPCSPPGSPGFTRRQSWRHGAVVAAAAVLVYAATLPHGLVWDDKILVPYVEGLFRNGGLGALLSAEFRLDKGGGYYRPLVLLSLWTDSLFAPWVPWIYHVTNVALHAVNSLLVLCLLSILGFGGQPALLGALLFACHPVHVESVAFVSGRTDLWATAFCLVAAILWKAAGEGGGGRGGWRYAGGALALALAGLAKESALLLPLVLLSWAWVRKDFRGGWAGSDRRWLTAWGCALATVLLLRLGAAQVGFGLGPQAGAESHVAAALADPLLFLSMGATYLRLLLVPWPLNAYYTPQNLDPAWALPLWVGVLGLASWRARGETRRAWVLAGIWTLGFLVPVLGVLPLRASIIAERHLYLPSVGLSLAAAGVLSGEEAAARRWYAAAAWAWIGVFALAVGVRSPVWTDDLTLFRDIVRTSPGSALAHYNLGVAYGARGRMSEAIGAYEAALRLQSDHLEARNNLGNAYAQMGRKKDAAAAFNELGAAYAGRGSQRDALDCYIQSIALDPGLGEAHYNLGNLYAHMGRFEDAAGAFRAAIERGPDRPEAYNNLGMALGALGRSPEAVEAFAQALRVRSDYPKARSNLDRLCREQGGSPEVAQACRRAGWRWAR